MKKLWLLVLALVVINAGVIVALAGSGGDGDDLTSAVRASAEGEGEEEEEEGGLGPAEPDDYFLFQRSTGGDLSRTPGLPRAVRQARAVRRSRAPERPTARRRWALEGPTNIGGRLVDLAIDRTTRTGLRRGSDRRRLEVDRRRRHVGAGVARRRRAVDRCDRDRSPTTRCGPAPVS